MKKKILKIGGAGGGIIILTAVIWYLLQSGIVIINIKKTPYKDPVSGKTITREELKGKSAADLYKDAVEFNKKGNYEDASAFLNNAIQKDENSSNINVMRELAVSYYNLKDYSQAIETYEKIIAVDPKNASAYNELGNVYRDKGDLAKAEENYKHSMATDSGYILAYNNLAMLYVLGNKIEEAKNVIKDGLDKNSGNRELERILKSLEANQ